MQTYKNLTDHEQVIPNVGVVAANGTIDSDTPLHNKYLQLISNEQPTPPAAVHPSANPVIPVQVQVAPVQPTTEPSQEGEH